MIWNQVYPRVCGGTFLVTFVWRSWLVQVYPRVCGGTS